MRLKFKLIFMFFLAFAVQVSAQEKTVTGVVTEEGLPLPGVNISIKGGQGTTQSDIDGKYSIKVSQGQTLVFTFLGMQDSNVVVGASNTLNVAMQTSATQLEGVVVEVAYGQQKKKAIVGSIATVGREILETQQLTNVTSAIQGSVPGVNVISSGGQPGEAPTIRVRGIGSINASASPLIIVDGAAYNGNLNAISQDQIETMSVLKDASSTALYGSRGSNGVILITTRKGKRNSAPKVRLSTQTGIAQRAVDMYDMVGAEDFMKYSWEADKNRRVRAGQTATVAGTAASAGLIASLGYNPYNVNNPIDANGNLVDGASLLWETDWEKEIYRKTAIRTEHSLSIEGGSDNTNYFFSTNYLNQEGAVKSSDFERITTRLNLDSKVKDWLQVGINTSIGVSNQSFPNQSGNAFSSANQWIYNVSSIYPLYRRDAAGALDLDGLGNPVYDYGATTGQTVNANRPLFSNENAVGALYNNSNKNRRTSSTINGYAKINFTDYLSFRTSLSYEHYQLGNKDYTSNLYGAAAEVGGRVSQERIETTTLNHINSLNFEKSFGNHKLNVDAIFEAYQMDYDYLLAQGTGFLTGVTSLNSSTTPESVGGYLNQERMVSYLGRIAYSFADKYFIEGSYRSDSSTKFSEYTRRGDFFSVGGSWIVSDEEFLKDSKILSFLKLKSSYGELGNNKIFDGVGGSGAELYFPYIQAYNTGWAHLDNPGILPGTGAREFGLTWEKTASFNAGIEFGFFNNRLEGGVEYYNKKSVDLIYSSPLTDSTGYLSLLNNVGSLRNYGIEVSLNSKNIISDDITWTTGLNFSFDRNEITELSQESFITGTKRWEVGKSLYEFYMQEWAGVDSADGMGMWYRDEVAPDGSVTKVTTKDYTQASRYYAKSALPDVIGGLTNYFRYKNFDLNVLFNFSYGGYLYDSQYASLMSGFSGVGRAASVDIENRWQNPGDVTDVPLLLNNQNNNAATSTRFLFKNDYVRLKALTLGYNLPNAFAEKMHMSKFRLYLQGDNLWTYQSHEGLDPEQNVGGTTDNRGYNMRTVSLGVKVEF